MSFVRALARTRRDQTEARSTIPFSQFLEWRISTSGESLAQAMRNAASGACISVLTRSIGRAPVDVVRMAGDDRVPVTPTPALIARPSGLVRPTVWRRQLALSLVTDGNAFGLVTGFGAGGYPAGLEWVDPSQVGDRAVEGGRGRVTIDGTRHDLFPFGPVVHIPGLIVPPGSPFGMSPLAHAARTIGTSLSVEDFSNQFFTQGAHPTVVATMDNDPGPEGAQRIKDMIRAATHKNREPLVLGAGIKLDRLQVPPGETQFLELWRFEVEQACRHWLVPPSMVYGATSGQNVTYANVTQADLSFLKHSLDDYFVSIEDALTDLLPRPDVVRVNRNAILRADPKARHELYEIRLRSKTMNVDEVRALEDEAPLEDKSQFSVDDAETIGGFIRAGFTAESVIDAVTAGDLTLLQHSGLPPVTVQPPRNTQPEQLV